MSLFEHSIFADLISKDKVVVSRVAPNSNMAGVLIKEDEAQRRAEGRSPCKDGGRGRRDESTSRGMPRIASNRQKLSQKQGPASPWNFR